MSDRKKVRGISTALIKRAHLSLEETAILEDAVEASEQFIDEAEREDPAERLIRLLEESTAPATLLNGQGGRQGGK